MKTLHLGPEELLVAAKVGVARAVAAEQLAAAIDAAEARHPRGRADSPRSSTSSPTSTARTTCPAERPEPPPPAGH